MFAFKKHIALAMAGILLASCGWVEVKPEGSGGSSRTKSVSSTAYQHVPGTVVVQKGDSVYKIARRHNVSMREVINVNGLKAPFRINVGQRLKLPQKPEYIVKRGDTLYSVSRKFNTDVYSLAKANKLRAPYTLRAGQKLKVPTAQRSTVQSARTAPSPQSKPNSPSKARVQATPQAKPTTIAKSEPRIAKNVIPKPPPRASSRFAWPVRGKVLSRFGVKKDGLHNDGINIAAKRGTAVKAAENGVVAYSGNELRGFGNMLLIKHSGGWITAYAHNEKLLVKRGDKVRKGQTIAAVGSTGGVTKPQLHFEIRKGMNPVNPKKYLGS